jgi:hypothetical protein
LSGTTPRYLDPVGVFNGLQVVFDLLGQSAQFVITGQPVIITPQYRCHDRDIINLDGFDPPGLAGGRTLVDLGKHFIVDFDKGIFPVLSHKKSHRHHTLVRAGHRVDILDTIDLMEKFF